MTDFPKLDPRETHVLIDGPEAGLKLFLRHLPPPGGSQKQGIVLHVHGGTFPSGLSVAHRFDGAWLRRSIPDGGDVKIPRATHLMHLEENRYALYRATEAFLTARED